MIATSSWIHIYLAKRSRAINQLSTYISFYKKFRLLFKIFSIWTHCPHAASHQLQYQFQTISIRYFYTDPQRAATTIKIVYASFFWAKEHVFNICFSCIADVSISQTLGYAHTQPTAQKHKILLMISQAAHFMVLLPALLRPPLAA